MRLLIEDVTLTREPEVIAKVRLKGGALQTLHLGKPRRSWETWQTNPKAIEEIDRLLNECTDEEIATHLNRTDSNPAKGFIHHSCSRSSSQPIQLKSRYDRLREAGMLTQGRSRRRWELLRTTFIAGGGMASLLPIRTTRKTNVCTNLRVTTGR